MGKDAIRHLMREKRRSIAPDVRAELNMRACQLLINDKNIINASNIAFYLSSDGELNIDLILNWAIDANKNCFVPCITDEKSLCFRKITHCDDLIVNKYGIKEPPSQNTSIPAQQLDIVLAPLVSFDHSFQRCGMGGGYYDRTFEFKRHTQSSTKPLYIGCAFELQRSEKLLANKWDILLDAIATEKGVIYR